MSDEVYQKGVSKIILNTPIQKFDAVRGSTLNDYVKDTNNVSVRAQYNLMAEHRISEMDLTNINSVGCYLSHITLWYQIVTEGLEGMYIFESDAICYSNKLDLTEFLRTDGDIMLFGSYLVRDPLKILKPMTTAPISKLSKDIGIVKLDQKFFQTHAYYMTYLGALKCLRYVFPIEVQIDGYLSLLIKLKKVNIYGIYPNLCEQTKHASLIQTKTAEHFQNVIDDNYNSIIIVLSLLVVTLLIAIVMISVRLTR